MLIGPIYDNLKTGGDDLRRNDRLYDRTSFSAYQEWLSEWLAMCNEDGRRGDVQERGMVPMTAGGTRAGERLNKGCSVVRNATVSIATHANLWVGCDKQAIGGGSGDRVRYGSSGAANVPEGPLAAHQPPCCGGRNLAM